MSSMISLTRRTLMRLTSETVVARWRVAVTALLVLSLSACASPEIGESAREGALAAAVESGGPFALDDMIAISPGSTSEISVLANDTCFPEGTVRLAVRVRPSNGTAEVGPAGSILYRPNEGFEGSDSFEYEAEGEGGVKAIAEVHVWVGDETMHPDSHRTVALSWMPPTKNVAGEPLRGLAGYRIHYWKDGESRHRAKSVEVTPSCRTSYTVTGLEPGVYWFAVLAFDGDDNQSALSAEVSKTIE